MSKMIFSKRSMVVLATLAVTGCIHRHPKSQPAATLPMVPATMPAAPATPVPVAPTTAPVATEDLGTVRPIPGVMKPPKPFIAFPKVQQAVTVLARPSTLLMEHASPDSPVALSEYGRQPVYGINDFHLGADLSANDVKKRLGPPAQLADNEDPWLVYRLNGNREMWLHFGGQYQNHLLAADVIRGVEDGYARERVFEAH
jgi:hypothetical protein